MNEAVGRHGPAWGAEGISGRAVSGGGAARQGVGTQCFSIQKLRAGDAKQTLKAGAAEFAMFVKN